jgi:hypothetical protein
VSSSVGCTVPGKTPGPPEGSPKKFLRTFWRVRCLRGIFSASVLGLYLRKLLHTEPLGDIMATLGIAQHTNWLVLNYEGMVRDAHAIGAISGPRGVVLPWRFSTHFAPNVCQPQSGASQPRSGYGSRARRRAS